MSNRELPVLWAITKGSFLNKLIILPIAFLLSAFLPIAVTIILILGGIYLAYEGAEKIYEFISGNKHSGNKIVRVDMSEKEILSLEKERVKSAILTDFILSVEIVIIALGTVTEKEIAVQIMVVTFIAILATVGVYGIVALIVRMDEFGLKLVNLNERKNSFSDIVGRGLVSALPWVIKGLSIVGTIALILVAGGIFTHNIHWIHDRFNMIPSLLKDLLVGLIVGAIAVALVMGFKKVFKK
jgi:hypothetical protein